MARMNGPVVKVCRRFGEALTPQKKVEKGLAKKNYPPGAHSRRVRPSTYGAQLAEKQKIKFIYGVLEKQFKKYYQRALNSSEVTGPKMLELLERRLDNVVFRLGFGVTRRQARQFVNHGHVAVNGQKVDIPSYEVKVGDVVSLTKHGQKSKAIIENLALKHKQPSWLSMSGNAKGQVMTLPNRDEVDAFIREQLVVEFYSR